MLDVSCGWEIIWKMLYIWLSAPPHFDHKTTRCNHAVAPLRSSFLMAFFLTGAKHKPAVQVKKSERTKTNTIFNSIGMEGRGFFFVNFESYARCVEMPSMCWFKVGSLQYNFSREPKANVSGLAGDCLLWQSNRLSLQRWLAHIRGDRVTSPHGQYIYCLNFWSWTLLRTGCNCSYRDSSTLICCWHELMINYCGTVVCMAKFHNSLSPGWSCQ